VFLVFFICWRIHAPSALVARFRTQAGVLSQSEIHARG
jgi:hypothetical protein